MCMLLSFEDLKKNAAEQYVESVADILKHNFAHGDYLFQIMSDDSNEIMMTMARIVSRAVAPKKKEMLEALVAAHTKEILGACQEIKEDNLMPAEVFGEGSFYDELAHGVQFILAKHILDQRDSLEDSIFVKVCEKLKGEFSEEQMSNKGFVLNLIEKTQCGWPLLVSNNFFESDPEVVLAAIEKDEWVVAFSEIKEIKDMKTNAERIECLKAMVEKNKVNQKEGVGVNEETAHNS